MPYGLCPNHRVRLYSDKSSLFDKNDEEIPFASVKMLVASRTPRQKKLGDAGGIPSRKSFLDVGGIPYSSGAKQYSFNEERVGPLFNLLNKHNKLKLPAVRCPKEVGRSDHPNYYLFHWMTSHATRSCHVLKDTILALVDEDILRLRPDQKTVAPNATSPEGKLGASSCSVICALLNDAHSDVPPLTDSDQETIVLATQAETPLIASICSGQI